MDQAVVDDLVGNAHGNLARVQEILAEHPDAVNGNASWNETALGAATQTGNRTIITYLLEHGAQADLFSAIVLGQNGDVQAMLAADSTLAHARGSHNLPALYYAAITGNREAADLLRRAGAPVNVEGAPMSALHGAIAFNQPEMVAWLIREGADLSAVDYEGKTPAERAAGNDEISAMLARGGAIA